MGTLAKAFGAVGDDNTRPNSIEYLTDIFHLPRQAVEAVPAVSTFQGFFVNFEFHKCVACGKVTGL
jgi:hypothetical protein